MRLIDRVKLVRNKLPDEMIWELADEAHRGRAILTLLDCDTDYYHELGVYNMYIKAHQDLLGLSVHIGHDFTYNKLLEIFDLMERYSKICAFL